MLHPGSLFVPACGQPLIALARITEHFYKAEIHALILKLSRVDDGVSSDEQEVIAVVKADNFVFPIVFKYECEMDADIQKTADPVAAVSFTCSNCSCVAQTSTSLAYFAQPRASHGNMTLGERNHLRAVHMKGVHAGYGQPDAHSGLCSACAIGNAQNVKGQDEGSRRWERPGQCMSMDGYGPVTPPDAYGNAYSFTLTDKYTDYLHIWFTLLPGDFQDGFDAIIRQSERLHNEALEEIKLSAKMRKKDIAAECSAAGKPVDMDPPNDPVLPPPNKLAILRTDNHPSFRKSEFMLSLRKEGVKQEFMSPHTHYQGGSHESFNDSMNRHCISALVHANAPHLFW